MRDLLTRRGLITLAGSAGLAACSGGAARPAAASTGEEPEVSPVEDLMREHGALDRMLLIYEACAERVRAQPELIDAVAATAGMVRSFIEDYHEKLEEDHVFPVLERAGTLTDLTAVLRRQHEAGRRVTARILDACQARSVDALLPQLRAFVRMYRPHEAREDTELFPAFARALPEADRDHLGQAFEEREHAQFGKAGFAGVVERVAAIERQVGILDLDQFTPK
jgi:hemerythrin-like domain-containing protein